MELNLNNIPQELKINALFCTWRLNSKGKMPINPVTGNFAKSNDKSTFNNYGTIIEYLPQYLSKNHEGQVTGGLGLGIFNGFSAIDIDNCIDPNGVFSDLANTIIEYMDSYTEISPSGKGIRIIFKTNVLINTDTHYIMNRNNGLEIYISDNTNKYVTLTGNSINKSDKIRDIDITYILDNFMKKPNSNVPTHNNTIDVVLDSDKRIKTALEVNPKFATAWNKTATGSGGSESEDDLSLLNLLARVLDGDYRAVESAFESSPYFKTKDQKHLDKWLVRTDYKIQSMQKAIKSYHDYRINDGDAFAYNDTGNAKLFVDAYHETIRYNFENNKWMIWNGNYWETDSFDRVKILAEIVIEQMRFKALNESNLEARKKMNSNINRVLNRGGKENMINEAQHLEGIPVTNTMFDLDDLHINTKSGIVDLETGKITPPTKEAMHSKYIDIEIDKTPPKTWLKFLTETYSDNQDLIEYVQRLLGYSMTGMTSEQALFIFHGDGSNGKSLLLETALKAMGNYGTTTSADLLVGGQTNNNKSEERLAVLIGTRFAMVEETETNSRLRESTIKTLTSDYGEVQARFLYGNPFSYKPKFKLIMATNHKPIIRGTDHGIWRRIKIIPHNNIIPDHKQDKMLGFKLEKELPQILWWIIEGAIKYIDSGLQEPQIIREQVNEYKSDMNIVERWIIDNCDRDDGYFETSKKLYLDFTEYCKENNEYIMTRNMFGNIMSKKYEATRRNQARGYVGLRIRSKTLIEKMEETKVEDDI